MSFAEAYPLSSCIYLASLNSSINLFLIFSSAGDLWNCLTADGLKLDFKLILTSNYLLCFGSRYSFLINSLMNLWYFFSNFLSTFFNSFLLSV
jgi:hypothetical protein